MSAPSHAPEATEPVASKILQNNSAVTIWPFQLLLTQDGVAARIIP